MSEQNFSSIDLLQIERHRRLMEKSAKFYATRSNAAQSTSQSLKNGDVQTKTLSSTGIQKNKELALTFHEIHEIVLPCKLHDIF